MPKDMPHLSAKDAPDLGSFNWEDPLLLEDQLSDEERMIRDSARAYAQEKLQPRIKTAFNDERIEPEIFKEMGAMGLLGTTIPEQYGGSNFGITGISVILNECAKTLTPSPLFATGVLGAYSISNFGTDRLLMYVVTISFQNVCS